MNNHIDAIIVGAGHNGLVTGAYLARQGWTVHVFERNNEIGGAIRSGEITLPDFIHDMYSSNQNMFLGSPVYQELKDELDEQGLAFVRSGKPYCNVFPDGTSLRVYADVERTLAHFKEHNEGDAKGWAELYEEFNAMKQTLLPMFYMPMPSKQMIPLLLDAIKTLGSDKVLHLARLLTYSIRELTDAYLETREAKTLLASWGMHVDFGPDVSAGAFLPMLEALSEMEAGMHVVKGGASNIVEALAGIIRVNGGQVHTNAEVEKIIVNDGVANGVRLNSGEEIFAQKCIVANLTPTVLFGKLLNHEEYSPEIRRNVKNYRYGPGTMMIHLALSEKVEWSASDEISEFGYVHIAPYVDDLARTYTQSLNGVLPDNPLVVVGQTSNVDSTRTPGDESILWIQVRTLPSRIKSDAKGEITELDWDKVKQQYADRVMNKLEKYIPDLKSKVLERVTYSPKDLERSNPNLDGGDSLSGSHHLHQNFMFRPFPGATGYRTSINSLCMVGAGTWPGAGNNAGSGYLASQEILSGKDNRSNSELVSSLATGVEDIVKLLMDVS